MDYNAGSYDIAVIGAGHAGIEAALAAARLGLKTLCFTINLDAVGNLACNPAIGGTGKGHLVRELDALGGEMAITADKACIQYRQLNLGKGPAVHSLRAQADRRRYQEVMKQTLERQENLLLKQAEVVELLVENSCVTGVKTRLGAIYNVKAAVVCTGTYLRGRVIIGDVTYESGPDGMFASTALAGCLKDLGLPLRRFKTGTPPRINGLSVDFSQMEIQRGDAEPETFSFQTAEPPANSAVCYLTYTSEATHEIIRANLHRSPLFSGVIEGTGPRYCPSIEDKVVRFADKSRHQLFIEPMGLCTEELYVQGFSSSLPEDVQLEMIRTVKGLENVHVQRPAYAIEYDCVDPQSLYPTLESKQISGLYGAGQFNGSSGYEEAAVQGFVAGVNAAHRILGREPFTIDRSEGYIGALIDDLVTKGTNEPYRMMTARTEYRLVHRQDNADERMCKKGYGLELVPKERLEAVEEKYRLVDEELKRLVRTGVAASDGLNSFLCEKGTAPVESGARLIDLLKRPKIMYDELAPFDKTRPELPVPVRRQVEIRAKYDGYIKRQMREIEQFRRAEDRLLPEDIDYMSLAGLRIEARQKLSQIKPRSIGQAGRISGVSPADMAALMIHLQMTNDKDK